MDTAKLNEHLFSAVTRVYAVLDGAAVPDLPVRLYEMRPPNYCLFTGELEPDMAWVAPYLVRLVPRTPFAEWVVNECWGKSWGIFAHSRQPIEEMRSHFRALVTAYDEKGNPMIFRFYDPRVLRRYLPTCNPGELKIFFGDVDACFAESEDQENLTQFTIGDGGLSETALPVQ
jgi:hypothetical protein